MIYLSRKAHFCAAHKLYNPKWSQEKNEEIFGLCANENWHGHNFDMVVTVKGEPDPETGFVMNFKDLNKIIKEEIIKKVDHRNLNMDVDFMKGKLPTCEIVVMEFWKIIKKALDENHPAVKLHCIKLYETNNSFAEYYGN